MRTSIIIIVCISSFFAHGMEKEEASSFSIVFNGTTINVKTGSIFDANNRVDLIVINKHLHKKLVDFVADYYRDQPTPFLDPNKNQNTPASTDHNLIKKKPPIPQKFYYTMLIPNRPASTTISPKEAIETITEYVTFTLAKSLTKIGLTKKEKTIAFAPLSPKSGFHRDHLTRGTATGIFTFLNQYPYAYEYMELFVKDSHDVDTYADLFLSSQEQLMDNS